MRTLGNVLKIKYLEFLREKEVGIYGASTRDQLKNLPKEQAYLTVTFDCSQDLVEKLITIIHKEMEFIRNRNQSDIDKVLKSLLKSKEESENYVLEGYDMNNIKNFEDIVKSI